MCKKGLVLILAIFCLMLLPISMQAEGYAIKLPESLTSVQESAFEGDGAIESVTVPETVKEIGSRAFAQCSKLATVRIESMDAVIAKDAFEEMASDAKKEKLNIIAMSTYRSYDYQVNLYNKYVKADGKEKADTYSGRPGHSEHQTGLAVDVYNGKENYTNFEKTDEFDWMKEHAHEYGFILRFPKEKEQETGYTYESWHYRYVGVEEANYIKEHNISFEEYYATIIKDW